MDAMVERIEKLERSVRRFRWTVGAVVCLSVVGLMMGQNAESRETPRVLHVDTLSANNVLAGRYILNSGGEVRGSWQVSDDIALFMLRPPGVAKRQGMAKMPGLLTLAVGPRAGEIKFEAKDRLFSSWWTTHDGATVISLCGKDDSRPMSRWLVNPEFGTSFSLGDKDGQTRAVLGRTSTVTERTGVEHEHPEASLVLFDEKGNLLHQVP